MRCFSWFIGELLSSLLARYRFFPLFFHRVVRVWSYTCVPCVLSLAANQPTRRSITSNVYPRCSAFTSCATVSPVIPFSFSILLPFRYPFDCLWNVTSCDRPSSLAVCSQLQRTGTRVTDLLKVCRFEKAGNERTNERTNGGHSPGEWIVRNSFVLPLTRQSASLNYLFQYIFFFWPVADSTVPIGLCLLIEKGLSVVSNPFNIAGNLTTFLKRTAVNVFLVLIRTTQDARWY